MVNAAYYAMLNAARVALSERGEHSNVDDARLRTLVSRRTREVLSKASGR